MTHIIMVHITWSNLIEEIICLTWAHVVVGKELGRLSTSVKSVCSLHTAVLQILLQSLNQDLGSALLLLRGDTESSQESKTPRRYSILPIQALHIDCLVSHAILFHVHEAVRFISLLFNPQGTSTRPWSWSLDHHTTCKRLLPLPNFCAPRE